MVQVRFPQNVHKNTVDNVIMVEYNLLLVQHPSDESVTEVSLHSSLFANQFSDTTDCEHSLPQYRRPPQQRCDPRQNPELLSSRKDIGCNTNNSISTSTMGSKTPLLSGKKIEDCDLEGYTKIPGSNSDVDSGDGLLSSVPFFENYKYSVEHKKKQSSLVTVFAVWNTIMGSSLLTMAWGIERAGLLSGILIMLFMGALCLFTSYTLLTVCYHHGNNAECEVPDLCRMLLGRWAEVIAQVFSVLVMFGANIVYWILMTNFLYYSVNYFRDLPLNITQPGVDPLDGVTCLNSMVPVNATATASWGGKYWDLYSSVPLYVALIIFPLLNFNSTTFFTKFNSLGTLSVVYLVVFVIMKGWGWGLHIDSWVAEFTMRTDFSVLSGMLALSFYIHNIIITVMRNNRHQENNGRDLSIAFVLVTLTYMLVGAVFYICFPLAKSCIEDNLLNNFVKSDIMTAVARVLLLFQVITVYPLIAYMLRVQCLGSASSLNPPSRSAVIFFNMLVVVICILFACFAPNIGTIIRYTGALSGLIHVFTIPSFLQMTSLYIRGKLTVLKVIFYSGIFLIGACNLIAQFFVN